MSPANLTPLVALILKVTLLLGSGILAAALLRKRSAAERHDVWTFALVAAVLLTLFGPVAPSIELAVAPPATSTTATTTAATDGPLRAGNGGEGVAAAPSRGTTPSVASGALANRRGLATGWPLSTLLAGLWALGTVAVLLWCAAGHLALRHLARRARPLEDGGWTTLLASAAALAGVRRPLLLCCSEAVGTPVTWGSRRPKIVLPADAETWPLERRRAALLHELAHVARHDYLVQLAGMAACALYWFHPAAWMAMRRLRAESERACDDRVLAAGTAPAEYAAQLLEVARGRRALHLAGAATAIGMARPSTLEGRLLAVLDESIPRRAAPARTRLLAAAALVALLVPFAGLTPVARGAVAGPFSQGATGTGNGITGAEAPPEAPEAVIDRSVAASGGERLRLDLDTGAGVDISAWDEPRVEVRGRLGGRDWRDTRVEVERESGGVLVRTRFAERRRSQSTSHSFRIRVPRAFDVELQSAGGDLTIDGVEGTFRGTTGGGSILLTNLRGTAHLTTGGGEVRVADSTLDGSVTTGGGLVTLSRVSGGLRGNSGSGPIIYAEPRDGGDPEKGTADLSALEIDEAGHVGFADGEPDAGADDLGRLHITRAGGEVELARAPHGAVISTGGGNVVVGRSAGLVDASTGGGDITIGPVAGSVRAGTGAGKVTVLLEDASGEEQTVEITSGSGAVVLVLPEGFDGVVELETAYTSSFGRATRIAAPWDLARETTGWDDREGSPRRYVRARGTAGNGQGRVRVKTLNGDIEVRRAG